MKIRICDMRYNGLCEFEVDDVKDIPEIYMSHDENIESIKDVRYNTQDFVAVYKDGGKRMRSWVKMKT